MSDGEEKKALLRIAEAAGLYAHTTPARVADWVIACLEERKSLLANRGLPDEESEPLNPEALIAECKKLEEQLLALGVDPSIFGRKT